LRQFCYWARRSDCCRPRTASWRAAGRPSDPTAAQRYLANAFGDHLDKARRAINELASRYEPAELNRIGLSLYEKFRPAVPYGTEGWGKRAVLDMEMRMPRAATSSGQ
jgi:hypothetical protein